MSDQWQGTVEAQSGLKYEIEVENVRPGEAPLFIWLAMEHDELPRGRAIVALVGDVNEVGAFARQCRVTGTRTVEHMVVILGTWPSVNMQDVVRSLQADGVGLKHWARTFRRRGRRDTDRKDWIPSQALVHELISIYVDQVRRFGPPEATL